MVDSVFGLVKWAIFLALGMGVCLEIGRRVGVWFRERDGELSDAPAVDGALFALLGLLVAFTFSAAAARFENRRHLVVEEANAIGTAYLRLDLLAPPARANLQESFRSYVKARLEAYRRIPDDIPGAKAELAHAVAIQGEIWTGAVRAAGEVPSTPPTMLLLPALNEMIDITSTRSAAFQAHTPPVIFAMLFGLALICAGTAGFGMAAKKRRNVLHMAAFAVVMASTVYVILDLEHPRAGLLRVDSADQLLVDVLASMK